MKTCLICNNDRVVESFPFHHYAVFICAGCGFRWLDPQPSDTELLEIYSEKYFLDEGDVKLTEMVNALKRATARLYLDQLDVENSASVSRYSLLEIGCGMGDFLLEAQRKGYKVHGLEVTDRLVEVANRRLGTACVKKGGVELSQFEKGTFDVIAFFDVIEHVRKPVDFMRLVNGLLKKTGRVYIVTPSLDSWSARLLGKKWMEYKVEHLSYFGRGSITHLLQDTGFQNIRFFPNYKVLNMDYINRHFIRFPVRGVSPLINFIRKITPNKLAYLPIKVIASGMAVIAEKA